MIEILKQIQLAIENGHSQETIELVTFALESGVAPQQIVEEGILLAMKGMDGKSEMEEDIPQILATARCIRNGFDTIANAGFKDVQESIGKVILGTVEGDLHDLGKNLVALMFRSAGFEVVDLGVDISAKQFLKAIQENPDVSVVCLSSLLNTSVPEMAQVVKRLRRNPDRSYKILVGGGAVTRELAEQMGADAYTETAAECAIMAKKLIEKSSEVPQK